ncbi:MAG: ATP--guanido phosphotransferase, partial [Clostridia bacterium]|nr:ATP--guanido phosphotransferase [Clostridia bacterium]
MSWYLKNGTEKDIFVSTRIRLARNISDYPFDPLLVPAAAEEIVEKAENALKDCGYENVSLEGERGVIFESHIISYELLKKKSPCALLSNEDKGVYVMVCEEDHLRIQSIRAGFELDEAYKNALEAEQTLDASVSFAYDEKLGYLTHCPTNLGTGMRASVMMFLPALAMTKKIKGLESALSKLGITVRGYDGEGSQSRGDLYQISNSVTLGVTEEEILTNLKNAAVSIAEAEREMRKRLMESDRSDALRDKVLRSLGVAKYAYMISTDEMFRLYSDIRLGAALGIIDKEAFKLDTVLFENTPARLEKRLGRELSPAERDKERA